MTNIKHRSTYMQELEAAGHTPEEIIAAVKNNPVYTPQHRDAKGSPLTFEALVSDFIRVQKFAPEAAVRAARAKAGLFERDYYARLRIGAASDLDWIMKGNRV